MTPAGRNLHSAWYVSEVKRLRDHPTNGPTPSPRCPCALPQTPAFKAAGGGVRAQLGDAVLLLPKAIESFALMVKQTAQMLQSFGTELAETELPNDVQSTSSVLCAHTEKKDKAKVHVVSV